MKGLKEIVWKFMFRKISLPHTFHWAESPAQAGKQPSYYCFLSSAFPGNRLEGYSLERARRPRCLTQGIEDRGEGSLPFPISLSGCFKPGLYITSRKPLNYSLEKWNGLRGMPQRVTFGDTILKIYLVILPLQWNPLIIKPYFVPKFSSNCLM